MNTVTFKKIVWGYYNKYGRDLPWRHDISPYKILVSEVMLQQTQVARVVLKYKEFLRKFPTLQSLALASKRDVLMAWSGLGYNRRALYLHGAATALSKEKEFPRTVDELVCLPGVGKNTAGAILVYAFNIPTVFIETNIRRVYIHHFFKRSKNISDKEILRYVVKTLDKENPREWYWALMDYGTFLSTQVENPNRKSKTYAKQSVFKGSLRQLRAQILKKILEKKILDTKLRLCFSDSRYNEAILSLQKEGFIEKKKGMWSVLENKKTFGKES